MSKKAFKKGDRVTRICDWDGRGTVAIREAIVHSCGAKRLILTDAESGEEIGRNFRPVRSDPSERVSRWGGDLIFPMLPREEAITIALESGALIAANEKASGELKLKNNSDQTGYCNAIRSMIADLHEPRFHIWQE